MQNLLGELFCTSISAPSCLTFCVVYLCEGCVSLMTHVLDGHSSKGGVCRSRGEPGYPTQKSGALLDIGDRQLKGRLAEGGPPDPSSRCPSHSATHQLCWDGVLLPTPSLLLCFIKLASPTEGE